jgi:hypothetical protein
VFTVAACIVCFAAGYWIGLSPHPSAVRARELIGRVWSP